MSIYFALVERISVFVMEKAETGHIPESLFTPYEQAGPTGPSRVIDERVRLHLKSYHPQRSPRIYSVKYPDQAADALDELFGDAPRPVTGSVETLESIDKGCKELSKTKIGVFAPPVSLPLPTPQHPYMNSFGDYTDEYWTSPEFVMVTQRIPEFLKQCGVTSISNATQGDLLAAQFEDFFALHYPDEWKQVNAMGPYGDALQAWHEDNENNVSE